MRALEEQQTLQRMDVPSADEYLRAARAIRARDKGLGPRARLAVEWVLPIALGILGAMLLALLTWLVLIA